MKRIGIFHVSVSSVFVILIGALIGISFARSTIGDVEPEKTPLVGAIHPPVVETLEPWKSSQIKTTSTNTGIIPYVPVTITEDVQLAEDASTITDSIERSVCETDSEIEPVMTYLGRYNVVGYDSCEACCGKTDGITKSGTIATVGRTIAANTNEFPFGTVLYIDGIGERVVEDRGYLKPGVLDVFCNDHSECYEITGVYDVYAVKKAP